MVFYGYIKGASAESGNPITKIIFKNKSEEGKNDAYPLITADGDDGNLGYLLTTAGENQTINKDFIFSGDQSITADTINVDTINTRELGGVLSIPKVLSNTEGEGITLTTGDKKTLALDSNGNVNASGNIDSEGVISAAGTVSSSSYITAPYFVATSDRRAKENIVSLPPLLNYVRSIPVYSFNFRENPSEPSIGIMAQDVESRFVGPFNLVQQPADPSSYKAVRESKLVYILWKAVQDLADEVDSLKWKLSKLEQGKGGN